MTGCLLAVDDGRWPRKPWLAETESSISFANTVVQRQVSGISDWRLRRHQLRFIELIDPLTGLNEDLPKNPCHWHLPNRLILRGSNPATGSGSKTDVCGQSEL